MSVTEMTSRTENGIALWDGIRKVTSGAKTVQFDHGLGRTPLIVQVQFSKDDQFDDVDIVQWSWANSHSRGPVSISADTKSVKLHFTSGHVFGSWTPASSWHKYSEGYFKVIAF
tara:strand:+ start:1461 stop:1802 length:342 start_codon:yes stop_codon:yes gene_type:complete